MRNLIDKKRIIRLLISLLFLSISSIANASSIEGFREMKWGDAPSKVGQHCTDRYYSNEKEFSCSKKGEKIKIGDVTIQDVTYSFFENKLYSIHIKYISSFYNIEPILIAKYGEPEMKAFQPDMSVWKDPKGNSVIHSTSYGTNNNGSIVFENAIIFQQLQEHRINKDKQKLDKAIEDL